MDWPALSTSLPLLFHLPSELSGPSPAILYCVLVLRTEYVYTVPCAEEYVPADPQITGDHIPTPPALKDVRKKVCSSPLELRSTFPSSHTLLFSPQSFINSGPRVLSVCFPSLSVARLVLFLGGGGLILYISPALLYLVSFTTAQPSPAHR